MRGQSSEKTPSLKKKGRPCEVDRSALLDAAEKLFAEKGFEGTTTREVVKQAKCNVALISYYFGGKDGLYQAVLLRYFDTIRARYSRIDSRPATLARQWPELKDHAHRHFCAVYYEIARKVTSQSPAQKIICRELMTGAAAVAAALARSEGGAYKVIGALLEELRDRARIRPDIDVRLAVVSLLGPVIYSCVAGPVLENVYGLGKLGESYVRSLCLHQTRTFFEGWGI